MSLATLLRDIEQREAAGLPTRELAAERLEQAQDKYLVEQLFSEWFSRISFFLAAGARPTLDLCQYTTPEPVRNALGMSEWNPSVGHGLNDPGHKAHELWLDFKRRLRAEGINAELVGKAFDTQTIYRYELQLTSISAKA